MQFTHTHIHNYYSLFFQTFRPQVHVYKQVALWFTIWTLDLSSLDAGQGMPLQHDSYIVLKIFLTTISTDHIQFVQNTDTDKI